LQKNESARLLKYQEELLQVLLIRKLNCKAHKSNSKNKKYKKIINNNLKM